MAIDIPEYLSSEEASPRLWIDFNAYARKLLLAEGGNPWTTPAAYMSFYGQAHALVNAEIVVINVWDLFQQWMQEDKDAVNSMAGKKRITVALRTMLEAYAPRELLAEVITAMSNNYGESVPMVLVMPSPRSLIAKAHKAANGDDVIPEESHVDAASMYVADFLRYYSETDLSGVLLMEDPDLMPASGEELSLYQPLLNVAKHYRWSVGVHLPLADGGFTVPEDIDFSIVPDQIAVTTNAGGTDITNLLWNEENENAIPASGKGFYYLSIPAETRPELVLDKLAGLRK